MTIREVLLSDFDTEAVSTRRVLERVPQDRLSWKPHEKSMSLQSLATHVAQLPLFGHTILATPLLDMAVTKFPSPEFESLEKLLEASAIATVALRGVLSGMSDDALQADWALRFGDRLIATGPKHQLYRTMYFNHLIHHRGQLNVYLRLLDVKVPGIYGPSADEPFGG